MAPDVSAPEAYVPFLFRQKQETNERCPSTIIGQPADEAEDLEYMRCSSAGTSKITQIYEAPTRSSAWSWPASS